jgi:homoserine dehydrogenase
VLADVARILAEKNVSIEAMIQKERGRGYEEGAIGSSPSPASSSASAVPAGGEEEPTVDIVFLLHTTKEKNVNAAIKDIEALASIRGDGKVMRIRRANLGRA